MDTTFIAQVRSALEDNKPYLALNVDMTDGKVEFGAAVFVQGNEYENWTNITPSDFAELMKLGYSRIYFHHADISSDDLSEQELTAALTVLGVPLP